MLIAAIIALAVQLVYRDQPLGMLYVPVRASLPNDLRPFGFAPTHSQAWRYRSSRHGPPSFVNLHLLLAMCFSGDSSDDLRLQPAGWKEQSPWRTLPSS